ncbi:SAM hydrolase/SAM-dependent halogenase family protein [Candidatus Galacturonibacter soehngenii]|uniref:SAM-dependent chlorinase/fluorinase n=1 Tax=Candidatus Galacturonatibacter soehngenii TaxID=2307010 RepID=A0A7V7QN77_9FIRM|nr:SAM-dependent chlorinase/fluorinase [Candidatus Galacturonibacter soehngenii]KAB1440439.1 SAM-dependent chlorinase/fluorinase [Candidatus Galacturonibacter soehngenii]MBA4688064.1 SAM-dependent chlorinase/fluorinase [Candidatus Galacturonibacter soehngenii]
MKPILVFQTDFTYAEGAVSSMYGVVKTVDRELEIFDGTHQLPQYDTWSASYRLYQSLQFWPEGTIYVSVVDPGVGTSRRACVAKTIDGYYIVTPDNGALTHVKHFIGIESVREIDETKNRLRGKGTEGVAIFHGRDLFGYTAARLASGIIDFEGVGPEYSVDEIVTHEILKPNVTQGKVQGIFEINDPNFGNLWTNIPLQAFQEAGFTYGDYVNVTIWHEEKEVYSERVLFHQSFGFAKKGDVMIYNNELMKVAMAVSLGNFCKKYGLDFGPDWKVEFTK